MFLPTPLTVFYLHGPHTLPDNQPVQMLPLWVWGEQGQPHGALVQNAQGGDATRAGSKYEQRGRWNYVNLGTRWLTFFPCSRALSGDGGWALTSRLHVAGV